MTIVEALSWGTEKIRASLAQKKIPKAHVPSQDAQLLLAHVLDVRKSYLFANGDQPLQDLQWDLYRSFIMRRAKHEPVSQIVGSAIFYGRSFFVNRHVLTPRPETEELVEHVLANASSTSAFLDIGTGSGAIAVTLALETNIPVYASDIDEQALCIARHNASQLGAPVEFYQGDLLAAFPAILPLENPTIISNVPYIPISDRHSIDPDVLDFEPHHALFGGIDGLDYADQLLRQLSQKQSFTLYLELDISNVQLCADLAHTYFPHAEIAAFQDLSRKPRFLKLIHNPLQTP